MYQESASFRGFRVILRLVAGVSHANL